MLMRRNFPTISSRTTSPSRFSDWLDEFFDEAMNFSTGTFVPELNVYETDNSFELTMELPGMKKEDIDISLEGNALTISGERKTEHEEDGRRYHRVESRFGTFRRTLPLPDIIKEKEINATYENGVLSINIPKAEEKASGKKIKVK